MPPDSPKRVLRLDFKFDFVGIQPSFFLQKLPKTQNLTKDKDVVIDGNVTWWRRKTDRLEYCLYDKKLDISERKLYLLNFGYEADTTNHYRHYLQIPDNITRFELRWNTVFFRDKDSSVNSVFANAENFAYNALEFLFRKRLEIFGEKALDTSAFALLLFGTETETLYDLQRAGEIANTKKNFEAYYRKLYGFL